MNAINGQLAASNNKFAIVNLKVNQLNKTLIDKARSMAGVQGYVTNKNIPDEDAIADYHQLFQIEVTFRRATSDLRARPIYDIKRDLIEAHLTIILCSIGN